MNPAVLRHMMSADAGGHAPWLLARPPGTPRDRAAEEKDFKDGLVVRRVMLAAVEPDRDKLQLRARVSLETADRSGDRVFVDGWETENWQKNPVVTWQHFYSLPPIASGLSIEKQPPHLVSTMQFWNGDGDWGDHAREIFSMYAAKPPNMSAFSVGFIPREWEARFEREGDREVFQGFDFKRQELLEYAAVTVPMHQDALALRSRPDDATKRDDVIAAAAAGEVHPGSAAELAELNTALVDLWADTMRRSLRRTQAGAAAR